MKEIPLDLNSRLSLQTIENGLSINFDDIGSYALIYLISPSIFDFFPSNQTTIINAHFLNQLRKNKVKILIKTGTTRYQNNNKYMDSDVFQLRAKGIRSDVDKFYRGLPAGGDVTAQKVAKMLLRRKDYYCAMLMIPVDVVKYGSKNESQLEIDVAQRLLRIYKVQKSEIANLKSNRKIHILKQRKWITTLKERNISAEKL